MVIDLYSVVNTFLYKHSLPSFSENMRVLPIILAFVFALCFISSYPVIADSKNYCLNTSTLYATSDIYTNGIRNYMEQNVTCPYGCLENACSQGSMLTETMLGLFLVIFFASTYIGYRFGSPILVIIAGVFELVFGIMLLIFGIYSGGMLYTVANSSFVTYIGIMFICMGVYSIGNGLGV